MEAGKKVLIVITQSNFGGAQRHVFDLAIGLKTRGYEVLVACGGRGVLLERLHENGIRTTSLPSLVRHISLRDDARALSAMTELVRKEHPNILHLHSSKAGILGAIAGRRIGVPHIIFTAHGWAFNEPRSFFSRTLFYIISVLTIILSHKTIAVSEALRKQMSFPLIKRKIVIVHNGITRANILKKSEARSALAEKIGTNTASEAELWIGTVAELHPVKGLSYAIQAFANIAKEYPNTRYTVIGDGQDREKLTKLIDELKIHNRVHLVGFLMDAARYESAFDIYVSSSLSEALSYSILEAGAAGLPVIATNVGGVPEVIPSTSMGLCVQPRSTAALETGLRTLLENNDLRNKLGENLRERVEKEFGLEQMFEETLKYYRT